MKRRDGGIALKNLTPVAKKSSRSSARSAKSTRNICGGFRFDRMMLALGPGELFVPRNLPALSKSKNEKSSISPDERNEFDIELAKIKGGISSMITCSMIFSRNCLVGLMLLSCVAIEAICNGHPQVC